MQRAAVHLTLEIDHLADRIPVLDPARAIEFRRLSGAVEAQLGIVAAQLEKNGIPSSEIEIVAKGKRDLLVPTKDGVKEPQNRRVQIVYGGAGA